MPERAAGALAAALALASATLLAACSPPGERIYVSNEWDGTVSVIDAAAREVVRTVEVGARPRGIQASADGRFVYVALSDDDRQQRGAGDAIVAIDTATDEVVARYAAGSDPEQFALSSDGAFLYAANEDAGTASISERATGEVLATLIVGIEPEGVGISPDDRWVYVTAETSNTVGVIDTAARRVAGSFLGSFLVDPRPRAAAFSPAARHRRRLGGRRGRPPGGGDDPGRRAAVGAGGGAGGRRRVSMSRPARSPVRLATIGLAVLLAPTSSMTIRADAAADGRPAETPASTSVGSCVAAGLRAGRPVRAGTAATDESPVDQATTARPDRPSLPDPSSPAPSPADETPPAPAAQIDDRIVVTATATPARRDDTAAAISVVTARDLADSAAVTLDEGLRQVPGFTLFRRSSSRTANPTIQGASLRGVGGSGAGRALVMADGVPLADPFGGWVAWGRVPAAAVERVEVLRGGASDLYGSAALAGVVHLLRRRPSAGELVADLSAGTEDTAAGSLWAATRAGRWAAAAAIGGLTSEGHVPLPAAARGPVDAPAGGRHGSAELTVERLPDDAGGPLLFLRGGVFDEERDNGTRLQVNATTIRHAAAGADWTTGTGGLTLRAWGAGHDFFQTFTAVADDRASERLVREQRVPSEALGGSLRWTRAAGDRHTLVAGVEAERTEGVSRERGFLAGGAVTDSAAGGVQRAAALHLEDVAVLGPRLSLAAGVRYDRWEDDPAAGGAAREADLLSPRLALRWQPRPAWGLTAAAYRSFRAPTLNELYRGFRVGDVVTAPNAELAAERLTGGELGAVWTPAAAPGRPRLRGAGFWMEIDDSVANVTLDAGPALIRRQRRNLGLTRSRGVEVEGEAAWGGGWRLAAGHLWTEAEVVDFPADPGLEGRRVPQVPEHQGSLALSRQGRRAAAALAARWSSRQYDDDRNLLPLGGFVVVDLRLAWRPRPALELYAAAENLLDEEVAVGRTPLRTVGAPRLVRVGVRWRGGGNGRPAGTPAATEAFP